MGRGEAARREGSGEGRGEGRGEHTPLEEKERGVPAAEADGQVRGWAEERGRTASRRGRRRSRRETTTTTSPTAPSVSATGTVTGRGAARRSPRQRRATEAADGRAAAPRVVGPLVGVPADESGGNCGMQCCAAEHASLWDLGPWTELSKFGAEIFSLEEQVGTEPLDIRLDASKNGASGKYSNRVVPRRHQWVAKPDEQEGHEEKGRKK